ADFNVRQQVANVATDDGFHVYRIEVDNTQVAGGPVRVYRDGVLILNGTLLGAGNNTVSSQQVAHQIWFGHATSPWAYGVSRWKSFSHNAALPFTNAIPEGISAAVEIYWQTTSNQAYQVQWAPALGSSNVWTDLGSAVIGDGFVKSVFDSTRNQPKRFYRVIPGP
ncbi:MAG TPA: hypothetical protein VFC07_12370, partial [Verrucomicrobiae bacterium]|nr:hypothetical protein [Verrucomicrobiae bacterium]